jgi:hypothetical protein
MALKLTLDTNSIIYLFDKTPDKAESFDDLATLIRYGLSGKAEIAITTRVESDLLSDPDEERRLQMLRSINMFPVLGTIARLDVTKLDGGDVLAGPELARLHDEVQQILFPGLAATDKRYRNKINDIDHVVGHKLNSRDIFVTDDRGIWRRRAALQAGPGVVVMKPVECTQYIDDIELRQTPRTLDPGNLHPDYHSAALQGVVTFDYSNHNGRYTIGEGHFLFETAWSKASNTQIHAYTDPPSIKALALARGAQQFADIRDAAALDYSSRVRTPKVGEIVVWQNANGIFAATKLVGIKDDSRGEVRDELTFEYVILSDGGADFAP